MLLYLLRSNPVFEILKLVDGQQWRALGGKAIIEPWVEVDFVQENDNKNFIAVDLLAINTGADGFLLSDFARQALASLLNEAGEFWPTRVMGQTYWWYNCTTVVKALNYSKTDAEWSTVQGDWGSFKWISSVRSLEFWPSQISRAPIMFRIPEFPQGILFARSALRNAVRNFGLTGFKFDLVWSAELGAVVNPTGFDFADMFAPISKSDLESQRRTARRLLAQRKNARD